MGEYANDNGDIRAERPKQRELSQGDTGRRLVTGRTISVANGTSTTSSDVRSESEMRTTTDIV
jgi:hypothetical protein